MTIALPAGFLTDEKFDALAAVAKGALVHMIENGEVPAFVGAPMTAEEAVAYLEGWLERNRSTLVEGSVDFLASLAKKIALGAEQEPLEEFEAALGSLSDEQLAAVIDAEADAIEGLKRDVIDRRRELLADLLETGKELLRGAIATGLHALMAEIQGSGLGNFLGGGAAEPTG